MKVGLAAVSVLAPGLPDWATAATVLRGDQPYAAAPLGDPPGVPANLKRRTGLSTRIAISTTGDAIAHAGLPPSAVAAVFASSAGSGAETNALLEALALPDMPVSPTQFHNSVHNAAVGYWCIGAGVQQPAASIAGHDHSFAAGLLKAAAQALEEGTPVVLTTFDAPFPAPLDGARPIGAPMSVSLVLTPAATSGGFGLHIDLVPPSPAAAASLPAALQSLAAGNPAGRALPLLTALAQGGGMVDLAFTPGLSVHVQAWRS